MNVTFRQAIRAEVPLIVAMLADDDLGATRESDDVSPYYAAFDAMQAESCNLLMVGEYNGDIIATYQLTIISGLTLKASRRAQIESVRVAAAYRAKGVGAQMMQDAETRARAAGCALLQLTTNKSRARAQDFYESIGFTASHIGFKRSLDLTGD